MRAPALLQQLSVQLGTRPESGVDSGSRVVVAQVTNRPPQRGQPAAEVSCFCGSECSWTDHVQGHVVAISGNLNFVAAATAAGDLLLYSPAGRRLLPAVRLGTPAAIVSADGGWNLLIVTVGGSLKLWDVQRLVCSVEADVSPLAGGDNVQSKCLYALCSINEPTWWHSVLVCAVYAKMFAFTTVLHMRTPLMKHQVWFPIVQ